MMRRMNMRNANRKGQALVETSLVLISFLGILMGALDFGQLLFFHQSLTERVRAGLRWGAVNQFSETGIKNMVRFNQSTATGGETPFLGLTDSNISVSRLDTGTATERIKVSIVNYQYQFFSPFLAKAFTNDLAIVEILPTEYRN